MCTFIGCARKVLARGLCSAHYQAAVKAKEIETRPQVRVAPGTLCSLEGCEKRSRVGGMCHAHYHKARRAENPGAYRRKRDPEKVKRYRKTARETRGDRIRAQRRHAQTGHSPENVARLREVQGRRCAICRVVFDAPAHKLTRECADHCHVSKRPRGLLCGACNSALGFYEKGQRRVGLLIEPYERYLAEHA